MRVTDVRTVLITAAWTGDSAWAAESPFRRTTALVIVDTDGGVSGVGETAAGYFCPEAVAPIVEYYAALLRDARLGLDPLLPERCFDELYQRSLWWGRVGLAVSVLSGIEIALWDIAGKTAGAPVHALLGGAAHARLPLYASAGTLAWPIERAVEQVTHYVDLGFRAVKVGTGFEGRPGGCVTSPVPPPYGTWYAADSAGRVTDERNKLAAIRDAVGADVELAVDSHAVQIRESWTRHRALDLALAIEEFNPLFYEEPLRYDDPEGYEWLRSRTRVPIAGGECLTGTDDFRRFLDFDALDVVQPDATHAGGIGVVRRVADAAANRNIGLIVHTGASVGPGYMANVHAAFASRNSRAIEHAVAPANLRDEFLVEPLHLEDGLVRAPSEPGLGISVPDDVERRWPFEPGLHEYA